MRKLALISLLALFPSVASADDVGIVKLKSNYSVQETMDRVENVAKAQGFRIWAREDFKSMGEKIDINIKPNQLLMFGKGKGGPKLISASPTAGLDLPLKVVAWEDERGQVWVAYTSADYIGDRHKIKGRDKAKLKISCLELITLLQHSHRRNLVELILQAPSPFWIYFHSLQYQLSFLS